MYKHKIEFNHMRLLLELHLLFFLFCFKVSICSAELQEEEKLYQNLFNGTGENSQRFLPVVTRGKPVTVEFGFNLINIVEVNARQQFITVHGWILHKWNNHRLKWNPDEYDGIDTLRVSPERVWVPDILLYNNLDEQDHVGGGLNTYKTLVVIHSNGTNTWSSPAFFKSFCRVQVDFFPLDNQTCELMFGSWSHDIKSLDIHPLNLKFPTEYYTKNGEWSVFNVSLFRKKHIYQCCENQFANIHFVIYISREAFDYLINLIIPCCLISSMIFLGFILPPESGERIGLSITVLLAMTVFQQLTSEIMPAYDFPILGQYYFFIVLEISASLVATTLILNFYHRTERKMPSWIRKVLLNWMSRLVLLHDEVLKKYPKNKNSSGESCKGKKAQCNEANKKSSFRASARQKETGSVANTSGYDRCYSDNIFSNEQALDKEIDEMKGLPRVSTYPFGGLGTMEMVVIEKEKNDNADITEKEREIRKWEWTLGARILDRCVLIVAIVIGFVTVTAVFLRAPSLWTDHSELDSANPIYIAGNHTEAED